MKEIHLEPMIFYIQKLWEPEYSSEFTENYLIAYIHPICGKGTIGQK